MGPGRGCLSGQRIELLETVPVFAESRSQAGQVKSGRVRLESIEAASRDQALRLVRLKKDLPLIKLY